MSPPRVADQIQTLFLFIFLHVIFFSTKNYQRYFQLMNAEIENPFLREGNTSSSVIEENKSRNALAELLDAKFGTGLTAIKASNFNTADRHKRSRVLRNLFLNKYKNPKQLHTQTRINFVFFVASR